MQPLVELESRESTSSDERVVACAAALFLSQGIAAVRMTDIADAAGVGVATLYRHYKTKTELAIRAGTLMWIRFNTQISQLVESGTFVASTGAARMTMLLEEYVKAYADHPDFVRFIDEFDHLMLVEGVDAARLAAYGASIGSFYAIFESAYQLGLSDGTITRTVDFDVFYRTVAHAMMAVAQKLVRGEIIPSDDFSTGSDELACIVQMALCTLGIER